MIHQIKSAWANDKIAEGVFLNISCAFDAVWHQGLPVGQIWVGPNQGHDK